MFGETEWWNPGVHLAECGPFMVAVAQLVELQFVVLAVAGSSPVGHPKGVRAHSCRSVVRVFTLPGRNMPL